MLYCINASCGAKSEKAIQHFASTLRIKGLGPKTIAKLGLSSIDELYSMDKGFVEIQLGSKLLSDKLLSEIENSKRAGLQELLPAFSIPLFGRTAAEKICEHISHVNEINVETCNKAGLGPKTAESLLKWKATTNWSLLPFSWKTTLKTDSPKGDLIEVVISGKLSSFKTKNEAKPFLEERGYVLKDNVTKNTKVLVNESGIASSKTKRAEAIGIRIITNILEIENGST
jgi:NAD-dependent DNA ligase